jgi:hypothetical protein
VRDTGFEPGEQPYRKLLHGVINHGEQMLTGTYRNRPITYFCPQTGIGRAIHTRREGVPQKVGIVGLGCGTLASYGRGGDVYRIYEINPLVLDLARSEFSYLRDSPARLEFALGDGRLSLEREPSQNFDLFIMDAFSSDSIPIHLITLEAIEGYLRHLKPDGILAVHISNKYLNLEPVMERAAAHLKMSAVIYHYDADDEEYYCYSCSWVLMMNPAARAALGDRLSSGAPLSGRAEFRPWTDDFSNMYAILK